MWLFAVIWNTLGLPIGWLVFKGNEDLGVFLAWALPLFVLTGVALLIVAVRETMRWRRFGGLTLDLDPFPGSVGGHMGGSVDLPLRPSDTFELKTTLACVHVRISKSSNSSSRFESVVWSRQVTPEVDRTGTGVRARFTFALPEDVPETEDPSASYHKWTVRVAAKLPGADLDQAFEIPVYRTAEPLLAENAVVGEEVAPDRDDFPSDVVRVERAGRGLVLTYPTGREGVMGVMMMIFGAVFGGSGLFMMGSVWEMGGGFSTPFGTVLVLFTGMFLSVFGGVGLFLVLAGVYTLINSLEVEIGGREIVATRSFLFRKRRTVRVEDVRSIEIGVHSQSGQGAKAKVYYRIRAMLADGGRLPLGDGILGSHMAERIGDLIEEETGIKPEIVIRNKKRKWKGKKV